MKRGLKQAYTKEDAYKNLERVNGWISSCDTKASILFGVLGVIIGLTSEVFTVFGFLKNVCVGTIDASNGVIALLVFQMIFIISYLASTAFSVYYLVNITKARVKSSARKEVKKSLLHFGSIAERTSDDFIADCKKIDEERLIEDINMQVWINSQICNSKFHFHKKAMRWIIVTGNLALITLILVNLI